MKKPLIVIGGPTACGKTGFSIRLAKEIGGGVRGVSSFPSRSMLFKLLRRLPTEPASPNSRPTSTTQPPSANSFLSQTAPSKNNTGGSATESPNCVSQTRCRVIWYRFFIATPRRMPYNALSIHPKSLFFNSYFSLV